MMDVPGLVGVIARCGDDLESGFWLKMSRCPEGWVVVFGDDLGFSTEGWGATPDEAADCAEKMMAVENFDCEMPSWARECLDSH